MEKTTQRLAQWSVLITKYYSGVQIKKNEMVEASGTYRRQDTRIQGFGRET